MYKFCVLSAYVCERLLILRDNVAVMQHLNHAALYPCFPQLTDHGTWSSGTTPLYVPVICRLPKIFTARVWACIFYADIDTNRYLAPSRAAYQRHLPWVHFKVPTGRLEIDRYVIWSVRSWERSCVRCVCAMRVAMRVAHIMHSFVSRILFAAAWRPRTPPRSWVVQQALCRQPQLQFGVRHWIRRFGSKRRRGSSNTCQSTRHHPAIRQCQFIVA